MNCKWLKIEIAGAKQAAEKGLNGSTGRKSSLRA
jgi:hypothetical protein